MVPLIGWTDEFLHEAEKNFGLSTELIDSVKELTDKNARKRENVYDVTVEEAKKLASCSFEKNTTWGNEVSRLLFELASYI